MPDAHALSATAAANTSDASVSRWQAGRRRTRALLDPAADGDRASLAVDILLVTLISLSVVAIILESVDALNRRYADWFRAFEILTVAVFSVEYLLRLWSSVESDGQGGALRKRLRYVVSLPAVIDLVAVLPFYLMAFGVAGTTDMRFLRAVRLLRVLKLTRYSAAFTTLSRAFTENARSFVAALSLLLIVMLIAATGMYFFERQAQPQAFGSIPAAMWWAFATLTTVGYGDVTPVTVGGKVFGAVITVVGVGMVALPTGILASAYTEQLRVRSDAYRQRSEAAWEDGVLSTEEARDLEALRESLGLGAHTASQILDAERVRAALKGGDACPHCGRRG